jgi:hypothetical protein
MTYAHLKIEGKDWLVPEGKRPMRKNYGSTDAEENRYWEDIRKFDHSNKQKTNWLEIHPGHVKEFEGRKGLAEDKDFEKKAFCPSCQLVQMRNCGYFDECKAWHYIAIPMTQDDGLQDWRDLIDMVSEGKHIDELQQSFTIKRKS